MRERIRQFLQQSQFHLYADEIVQLLRPSIRIKTHREALSSRSHFGGCPTVPSSLVFPTWDISPYLQSELDYIQKHSSMPESYRSGYLARIRGRLRHSTVEPLSHLCQIYLRELPPLKDVCGLPPEGVLIFFYDLENCPGGHRASSQGSWRCVYLDAEAEKRIRREKQNSYKGEYFPRCSLTFSEEWMLGIPEYAVEAAARYSIEWNALAEILEEQFDVKRATVACGVEHRLFGYDGPEPMERLCQLRSQGIDGYAKQSSAVEKGAKDWKLLLQLDSDENLSWEFGDSGRLYFWIRQQDLKALDFSNVWLEMQCA